MSNEPAITIGSVTALIGAVIVLLTEFGVDLSASQQKAINAVVLIGAPIVAALLIRRKVTPSA